MPASCSGTDVKVPSAPSAVHASFPIRMNCESTEPSSLNVVMCLDSSGFVTTTLSYDFTPSVLNVVRYESRPGMPPVSAPMSKDGRAPTGRVGCPSPPPAGVGVAAPAGVVVAVLPPQAATARTIGRSSAAPMAARVGRIMDAFPVCDGRSSVGPAA